MGRSHPARRDNCRCRHAGSRACDHVPRRHLGRVLGRTGGRPAASRSTGPRRHCGFAYGRRACALLHARHARGPNLDLYYRPTDRALPFRLKQYDGGAERARFVCGYLGCDARPFNPVLHGLPRLLHARAGRRWMHGALSGWRSRNRNAPLGRRDGSAKVADSCSWMSCGRHIDTLPPEASGWLSALRDPHVGAALALLHGRPAEAWTVERLAREVGLSRSVFADRFAHFVQDSPMHYLTRWRMQLASRLLDRPNVGVAQVAAEVGYESGGRLQSRLQEVRWRAPPAPGAAAGRRQQSRRNDALRGGFTSRCFTQSRSGRRRETHTAELQDSWERDPGGPAPKCRIANNDRDIPNRQTAVQDRPSPGTWERTLRCVQVPTTTSHSARFTRSRSRAGSSAARLIAALRLGNLLAGSVRDENWLALPAHGGDLAGLDRPQIDLGGRFGPGVGGRIHAVHHRPHAGSRADAGESCG